MKTTEMHFDKGAVLIRATVEADAERFVPVVENTAGELENVQTFKRVSYENGRMTIDLIVAPPGWVSSGAHPEIAPEGFTVGQRGYGPAIGAGPDVTKEKPKRDKKS